MYKSFLLLALSGAILTSCQSEDYSLNSPNGEITIGFNVDSNGVSYNLKSDKSKILEDSKLSFALQNMPDLGEGLEVVEVTYNSEDSSWEQPWGEQRVIDCNYNEMLVELAEKAEPFRKLNIRFRAFDDGIGFRYEFPEQAAMNNFVIMQERSEFNFAQGGDTWSIPSPAYYQRYYESLYTKRAISEISDTVTTPVAIKFEDGKYASIHEAALTNYAKMNLYSQGGNSLNTELSPWSTGEKVFAQTPFESPWRTIVLGDTAGELVTSRLMLNLNEPSKLEDINEWFTPSTYVGIWWGMHMKTYTWESGPKHGATTDNTKKYIDFAAKNGITGVLVEGWNYTWDNNWTLNSDIFDFSRPYPDFDIDELSRYGAERGVSIIGHHETAGGVKNYESQLDEAYKFAEDHNIKVVKTGYVSKYLDKVEVHDGQYGVRHAVKVAQSAAKHHVAVVQHEPVMPTGVLRTYPNMVAYEGMRGQEYDAWSADGGNPPSHTCTLPFTRGLAGPMDFTPGTFYLTKSSNPITRVQTTLAKQLALYIVIYSPVQMASDMVENYEGVPAFDFIREVSCDWEQTMVPESEIGEYILTVRKDRNSERWFAGAITNDTARELTLDLEFLDKDAKYMAYIYEDGEDCSWKDNPYAINIYNKEVSANDKLTLELASGGGVAIRFEKL